MQHKLKIISTYDAKAECTCGKWSMVFTGEMNIDEFVNEFNKHFNKKCSHLLTKSIYNNEKLQGYRCLNCNLLIKVNPAYLKGGKKTSKIK